MTFFTRKSESKAIKRKAFRRRNLIDFKKVILRLFLLLLVCSFSFGIYYVLYKSPFFTIQSIKISGASNFVNKTDLQNFIQPKLMGKRIFLVNTQELSLEISKMFLGAKSVEIKKHFPSEILVLIQERVPLALLRNNYSSELFLVDNEGYLLGTVSLDYSDLPIIDYSGPLKVGEFVNKDLVPVYFDIIHSLEENKIQISSMSFHTNHISLFTSDGVRVLIGNDKNISFVLATLSKLLELLNLENKNPKSIDLRYDKVVVSY